MQTTSKIWKQIKKMQTKSSEANRKSAVIINVGLSPYKKIFVDLKDSPSKLMKKCSLFYLESSFRPEDTWIFVLTFCHVEKTVWLER